MDSTITKAHKAAMAAHAAWMDDTEEGPSLRALVKAWAKHYGVSSPEVWDALDPYLD